MTVLDDTMSMPFLVETPMKIPMLASRNVQIRPVIVRDYKDLAIIEQRVGSDVQWGMSGFHKYLRAANATGFVAHSNNSCIAFILASQQASFVEVDYVAVHPQFQRQCVGTRLVVKVMNAIGSYKDGNPRNNELSNLRISATKTEHRLTATVHERNVAAQLFLRSMGFTAVNYYAGVREDGADAVGFELKFS
jgi:ribosomal protein S18 acetylase RimI-like enzyme